ncbi:MAG: selenocysteine-specific translation elongation factor [Anaerolineales bacterium]
MRVLGTAGHVDHGKSALVKALTGIDPDRLQEEKDRQMTIDLGFAWMTLPSGEGLGIIDVPGHRDFMDNMLAGVGGIDAALLVVAADEGVMPQTREHLAILDLLAIPELIVAITKIDLNADPEWLELVQGEIRSLLELSRYPEAEIYLVSSVSRVGLAELTQSLDTILTTASQRADGRRPRLPVDRVFSMAGFGTVVTGTLLDGSLQVGDEVELLPGGLRARLRGLQTHKQSVSVAHPGSRVAANLPGVNVDQVQRGDVVAYPGTDASTRVVDVSFRVLADRGLSIGHNSAAKFFSGSANRMARIRVLSEGPLRSGQNGWLQLVLDSPVVVRRGDRFILRRPSPGATLGGGQVANPHPTRIHKRADPTVVQGLTRLLSSDPEEVLLQLIGDDGPSRLPAALEVAGLDSGTIEAAVDRLERAGKLVLLEGPKPLAEQWVIGGSAWSAAVQQATELLKAYHGRYPLRSGMSVEELRGQLGPGASELFEAMVLRGIVRQSSSRVGLPEFAVRLSSSEAASVSSLLERFAAAPYAPPDWDVCKKLVGEEVLGSLVENGELVKLSEIVLLSRETYSQMIEWVRERLREVGKVTVAEVRDRFVTSRKYALALLEHLDQIGVTARDGDFHRQVSPAGNN